MKKILELLNAMRSSGIIKEYAIGGAIAALRWAEPFFTRDLDIFVLMPEPNSDKDLIVLSPIYDYLKNRNYKDWIGQWLMIEGIPVEFIPAADLSREAVENGVVVEFEGVETKVITPEYLIAQFLQAGRDKDIVKVRLLLDQASIDNEQLEDILVRFKLRDKFKRLTGR